MKFLSRPLVHRFFLSLFVLSTLSFLAGCAGTVLGDAENVFSVITLAVSTLSGIAAFIPGAGALSAGLSAVGATLSTLNELFTEYKTTATETTFQKIQQFVTLLQQNLQALTAPEGLSATVVAKINSIVSVVITQVGVWLGLIQQLQAPAATASVEEEIAAKPETITLIKPMSSKALHAQLKTIVETKTGDAVADWAFETANRF